jgi:hypothetical protein
MSRLTVVGTGIMAGFQTTPESIEAIRSADKVLYVMTEPLAEKWIVELNSSAESLDHFYGLGKDRSTTYAEMAEEVLRWLAYCDVCLALYGHPGVFATPGHLAIKMARAAGHGAKMLPGVSAEDCLIADLGIDPGDGLVSMEAVAWLDGSRGFFVELPLLLWQPTAVGDRVGRDAVSHEGINRLSDRLSSVYGTDHMVTLYEASTVPDKLPTIRLVNCHSLKSMVITEMMSLYVPPLSRKGSD